MTIMLSLSAHASDLHGLAALAVIPLGIQNGQRRNQRVHRAVKSMEGRWTRGLWTGGHIHPSCSGSISSHWTLAGSKVLDSWTSEDVFIDRFKLFSIQALPERGTRTALSSSSWPITCIGIVPGGSWKYFQILARLLFNVALGYYWYSLFRESWVCCLLWCHWTVGRANLQLWEDCKLTHTSGCCHLWAQWPAMLLVNSKTQQLHHCPSVYNHIQWIRHIRTQYSGCLLDGCSPLAFELLQKNKRLATKGIMVTHAGKLAHDSSSQAIYCKCGQLTHNESHTVKWKIITTTIGTLMEQLTLQNIAGPQMYWAEQVSGFIVVRCILDSHHQKCIAIPNRKMVSRRRKDSRRKRINHNLFSSMFGNSSNCDTCRHNPNSIINSP